MPCCNPRSAGQSTGTTVRLVGFREPYRQEFHGSAEQLAQRLVEHFLLIFLESDCPRITIEDGSFAYSVNEVFERNIVPQPKSTRLR
jgi:hypothetical protein